MSVLQPVEVLVNVAEDHLTPIHVTAPRHVPIAHSPGCQSPFPIKAYFLWAENAPSLPRCLRCVCPAKLC